ncbi:MAG: DUF1659 domain-containing protein [Clostridia bacterium]|jgi:hypothetical protein|nr:DUF1659 domain-containing protein [Clostridia bacterium]
MAVEKYPVRSTVTIQVETGLDGQGNPTFRNRTYNNVKPTADYADVYSVAEGLASLQIYPLAFVQLNEQSQLLEM